MILFAIPNLLLVLNYKIRKSKDVALKVFLILFYAYPALLLCLLRLKKVVSVSFNDGQKVCNQNYFTGKYPLELKNVGPNQYELWASGQIGTCDWTQILFSGGYYLLILVIVLNIVVLRKHVVEEVKGFFKYSKKTLYQKIDRLRRIRKQRTDENEELLQVHNSNE